MKRPDAWVQRYWRGEGPGAIRLLVTAVTAPASLLFGVGVHLRNRAWDAGLFRPEAAPIPVISVGNLSVGGTGKTPVTRWVVGRLLARGERPAVISRGYGADELALHRRWHPGVPVLANPRRIRAAREAAGAGATVAVMDDGFQHRALARDADIVLLSAHDPFPPRLLPRGPWREPLSALGRASLVLATGKGADGIREAEALLDTLRALPRHPPMGRLGLEGGGWLPLEATAAPRSEAAPDRPLLVVASVARPETVLALVPDSGAGVELLAFPDHHRYDDSDVRRILELARGRTIVTTEKDAVKLEAFPALLAPDAPPVRVLALEPLPGPGVEALLDRLLDRALGQARPGGAS